MQKMAIVDIDGVITDFYKIDSEIISVLYGKNILVKLLDKLLWKINSLDLITNRFFIFRLRMLLYSMFSLTSYKQNMAYYKKQYISKTREYFKDFLNSEYAKLKNCGIDVVMLTCDPFDSFYGEGVTVVQDKTRYLLDNMPNRCNQVFVIGNNYMDDICAGLKLRKFMKRPQNVAVFYIGDSKLVKRLIGKKNVVVCDGLHEAISCITLAINDIADDTKNVTN